MGDQRSHKKGFDQPHDHSPHWIFKLGILLNFSFFIADMIVWWQITGSAAIFGDSLHNGFHALAHGAALWGHSLEKKSRGAYESYKSKKRKYNAVQVIGFTIIAGAILIWIFGGMQIYKPQDIASKFLILMATLDILSNGILVALLWRHRKDPTVHALFYDIAIDTLASVGVIAGGTAILFTNYYRADGIAAIPIGFIALVLAREAIKNAKHGAENLHKH